ncbi:MAG: hypothetical protein HYR58_05490 [Acidobacteria bacterium]|nr:hypothetical protein [Acidobacteriota bacterium]
MLDTKLIHSLPKLPTPILTVYLDTNPANPRNQRIPSGARIWLKSRAKVLAARSPRAEQKLFREQVERVDKFLRSPAPRERGMVVFAGPDVWLELPLQVDVEDELHWGRPSLTQLLWLLDEHQPSGVVLVDRSGARFFRFWLGEIEEDAKEFFRLDISQWRKKHLMPPAQPGMQKTRGSMRDVFEQRVEAQFARFFRDAAEKIAAWVQREKLRPVFIAGPNESVEPVWAALPKTLCEHAARVKGFSGKITPAELQQRIAPESDRWKRAYELAVVNKLLAQSNGRRAVVGMDETLANLQQGEVRELVVVRGLGGKLRQCVRCQWADRSADPACSACGGERRTIALRAALPELARENGVTVEVVAGEAATKLRAAGGLAAWLR